MKKICILIMVMTVVVSLNSMGQASLWEKVKMPFRTCAQQERAKSTCFIILSGDKVWLVKNGSTNILKEVFVTLNGTLVMPDGSIRLQNKESDKMKEGDIIDWYGILIPAGKEKTLPDAFF